MQVIIEKLRAGMNNPKTAPEALKWIAWTIGALEGAGGVSQVDNRVTELAGIMAELNNKVNRLQAELLTMRQEAAAAIGAAGGGGS